MDWSEWSTAPYWLAFGLLGQLAFASRFLIQWIASERAGESFVPVSFWYLSLVGSSILLLYAIHRRDPVFTLGFLPNLVVYSRNLALLGRQGATRSPSRAARAGGAGGVGEDSARDAAPRR